MTKKQRVQHANEAIARLEARMDHRTADEKDAARAAAIQRELDGRSRTSRANLGDHIPTALGYGESKVLTVRVPAAVAAELDAEVARSGLTRSDIVRWCIERALPESRTIEPYEPW